MICLICGKASADALTHPGCRGRYTIDGCFAIVQYKGIIKKLLYQYKYKPNLSDLHRFMTELFYEGMIQSEELYKLFPNAILMPIPLHSSRLRSRGYDQVSLLTKSIAKKTGLPILKGLKRIKKTESQFGLKREDRLKNIRDAFVVLEYHKQKDRTILLVDDIVTSGTTLAEAARVLKRGGYKKVYGLAFAHGE
jgi:competence protein ComFC